MSLDVYLSVDEPMTQPKRSGIFIREFGQMRELSRAEWKRLYPESQPATYVETPDESNIIFTRNITHNLTEMARKADLYEPLWRPDNLDIDKAEQLIAPLSEGLRRLKSDPTLY